MEKIKNKAKAYFIDLDGTFLDKPFGHGTVSDINIQVAHKVNKTKPVIFSTGRGNTKLTMDIVHKVGSPYAVCLNGALIVDKDNNVLYRKTMDKNITLEVLDIFKKNNMFIFVNGIMTMYHSGNLDSEFMKEWAMKCEKKDYSMIPNDIEFSKLLVFGLNRENTKILWEQLSNKFPQLAFYLVSNGWTIEVGPLDANKGIANREVCNYLNINPQEAYHIGDSANDVPAKKYLGKFIAMNGSLDFVKKQADYVACDYIDAGLSKVLIELEDLDN
ncbi:HAD-IIB family hydrolase [Mycoplasma zalophidermidis]|uniref:HAD family hydrolase n=1 Tax=Mycoplasma zalophidermidis TaxID=398174 RepID=A0ABS6DRM3_9MOLU|nr:HAD-IIB family hydrolase [Mycoplasma zalophidermidis]MBU4689634.1 HAD family hydrolase [Mycoplasma zalophidermidis]MBU4693532.1 HAD family hydrolase [Mycoplasma zalophidermidis]MCR8966508.1 HAD family hydrolase [Mycoplasma zalophidermidis]